MHNYVIGTLGEISRNKPAKIYETSLYVEVTVQPRNKSRKYNFQ